MASIAEDRQYMGTKGDAEAALIEKARAWRETRQPVIGPAHTVRAMEKLDQQFRFELANAAVLWLWHIENPE